MVNQQQSQPPVAWAIVDATHPRAVVAFSCMALAVAALAERGLPSWGVVWGIVWAMAPLQVAIGLYNEYWDRDLDALAKTDRAVPRGVLTPARAHWAAWVSLVLGLGCASILSPRGSLVLALGGGMGFLYSARLKRTVWSWLPYAVAYPIVPVWVWVTLGVSRIELLWVYPVVAPFAVGSTCAINCATTRLMRRKGCAGWCSASACGRPASAALLSWP